MLSAQSYCSHKMVWEAKRCHCTDCGQEWVLQYRRPKANETKPIPLCWRPVDPDNEYAPFKPTKRYKQKGFSA